MKQFLFIVLYLAIPFYTSAQDCEDLVSSNGMGEYYQKDKTLGRALHKPILADIWVDRIGEYVYLNLTLKDSISNVTLHKTYGDMILNFYFTGKRISYSFKDTSLSAVISIPLNKDPDAGVAISMIRQDDTIGLRTYEPFLESIYKERLNYISLNKRNPNYPQSGALYSESISIDMKETESLRLQESLVCIFKAIQ